MLCNGLHLLRQMEIDFSRIYHNCFYTNLTQALLFHICDGGQEDRGEGNGGHHQIHPQLQVNLAATWYLANTETSC